MNKPLSILLEQARMNILNATNQAIQESNLPSYLIEGVLCDVLSDIRKQKAVELVMDYEKMNEVKEGESDGEH